MFYTDPKGSYYAEITKDTESPADLGDVERREILPGDEYGLSQ